MKQLLAQAKKLNTSDRYVTSSEFGPVLDTLRKKGMAPMVAHAKATIKHTGKEKGAAMDSTVDHKARRFMQIAQLERQLTLQASTVRDAKAHVKDLEKEYDAILSEIRTAARDEGELPLLDMMEAVGGKAS